MSATPLSFPPFHLDPANACLWRGTKRLALPPKDLTVLHYLVSHAGQLVTHEEFLKAVWPDTIVSAKGLKAFVRRLRRVLGDNAAKPLFIETVHGQGYRFVGEVVSREEENQKSKGKNPKIPIRNRKPKRVFSRLSKLHSASKRNRSNSARPLAWPVCGNSKASTTKPATYCPRSTAGSPRGLTRRTYKRQGCYWKT